MDSIKFCTGSKYTGPFATVKHLMDGFGTYTYPDGSIYRGNFRTGRFHGYGQLKLSEPYNTTFTGVFDNGTLVNVHCIVFDDGLHFYDNDADDKSDGSPLENWPYCRNGDRRYLRELYNGLAPPSGRTNITANMHMRNIRQGYYDTEEGFYWPVSGFITNIQKPAPMIRFVDNAKELEWIKTHCRYGGNAFVDCRRAKNIGVPLHPICPEIIKNNLETMQKMESEDVLTRGTLQNLKHLNLCEGLLSSPFDDASSAARAECYQTQSSNSSVGMDSLDLSLMRNLKASVCTPASSKLTLNQKDSESYFLSFDEQEQSSSSFSAEETDVEEAKLGHEKESVADVDKEVRRVRISLNKKLAKTLL